MEKKKYELCEMRIFVYTASDVVRTSEPQINGVTQDCFNDENWYQGGVN